MGDQGVPVIVELAIGGAVIYGAVKLFEYQNARWRQQNALAGAQAYRDRLNARAAELGAVGSVEVLEHLGGHPQLGLGTTIAWSANDGVRMANLDSGPLVLIPYDAISSITAKNQVTQVRGDESRTTMTIKFQNIRTKVVFAGGQETHARVASLLSKAADR